MRRDINDDQFRAIVTRGMLGFALQKAFCKESGINASAWNQVENGKRNIGLGQAKKIRRNFDISLDWLLDAELRVLSEEQQRFVRLALAGEKLPTAAA